MKEIPETRRSQ